MSTVPIIQEIYFFPISNVNFMQQLNEALFEEKKKK